MTPTAIILILISAFFHALWNLKSKQERPSLITFFIAMGFPLLMSLIFFFTIPDLLLTIPANVYGLLLATGMFEAIYFWGLASAYQAGDMTAVYPLVRAVPILMVTLISLILGHVQVFSFVSLLGMALIVIGCLLVPLSGNHGKKFVLRQYFSRANIFAVVAAVGTSSYLLVDDTALKVLRGCENLPQLNLLLTTIYTVLSFASAFIWLGIIILTLKQQRLALKQLTIKQCRVPLFTGLMILGTYLLVLISLAFVRDVSFATAFRQVSVIIGLLLGIVYLKEEPGRFRVLGTLVIFAGLVMVAVG